MTVSAREIRAARKAAQLTQGEAAKLVGVTLTSWQRWETRRALTSSRQMPNSAWELFQIKTQQMKDAR